jgi:hypothetical protein
VSSCSLVSLLQACKRNDSFLCINQLNKSNSDMFSPKDNNSPWHLVLFLPLFCCFGFNPVVVGQQPFSAGASCSSRVGKSIHIYSFSLLLVSLSSPLMMIREAASESSLSPPSFHYCSELPLQAPTRKAFFGLRPARHLTAGDKEGGTHSFYYYYKYCSVGMGRTVAEACLQCGRRRRTSDLVLFFCLGIA